MYTFKKEERLCNKGLIERLYHNGSSFLCYPFKVSWLCIDGPLVYPAQILFSVSKKRYKRAVDRNLIRRHMREAYRLNKQQYLYDQLERDKKNVILSLGYVGKEIADHDFTRKRMVKVLTQLSRELSK